MPQLLELPDELLLKTCYWVTKPDGTTILVSLRADGTEFIRASRGCTANKKLWLIYKEARNTDPTYHFDVALDYPNGLQSTPPGPLFARMPHVALSVPATTITRTIPLDQLKRVSFHVAFVDVALLDDELCPIVTLQSAKALLLPFEQLNSATNVKVNMQYLTIANPSSPAKTPKYNALALRRIREYTPASALRCVVKNLVRYDIRTENVERTIAMKRSDGTWTRHMVQQGGREFHSDRELLKVLEEAEAEWIADHPDRGDGRVARQSRGCCERWRWKMRVWGLVGGR